MSILNPGGAGILPVPKRAGVARFHGGYEARGLNPRSCIRVVSCIARAAHGAAPLIFANLGRSLTVLCILFLSATYASYAAEQSKSKLQQANSLSARGQYQSAVALYEQAAAEQPKNALVFHMWGRTLALMSDLSGACEQYRKAVDLAPRNAELINDLGVALSASGYLDEAVAQFRRVNQVSPQFVQAYNNLGVTLMRKGNYKDAVDAFKFSLRLQPKNTAVQSKLEEALKHSGAFRQAHPAQPAESANDAGDNSDTKSLSPH